MIDLAYPVLTVRQFCIRDGKLACNEVGLRVPPAIRNNLTAHGQRDATSRRANSDG
jgi:hypothetical protein